MKICKICGRELPNSRRNRCGACNTKIRRYRTKLAGVKLLGGKCVKCGWSGHIASFVFHHKGSSKLFDIKHGANKPWYQIEAELKKCELYCANCHAIYHYGDISDAFIKEVYNYNGTLLDLM